MSGPEEQEEELAQEQEDELSKRKGCRSCLSWLVGAFLILLLLALFWPVPERQKKKVSPYAPPKFFVSKTTNVVLSERRLKSLRLESNYRTKFVLVSFELENKERRISSLSYDNFEIIAKVGRLTKKVPALVASEGLEIEEENPWGKPLESNQTAKLNLIFKIGKDAKVKAFRVYDADRRSNRYKEFKI